MTDDRDREPPLARVHGAVGTLRELGADLLALVWPTACVGCGDPDRDVCRECLRTAHEASPLRRDDLDVPVLVRGRYDGVVRAMLLGFKHAGRTAFAAPLAELLRAPLAEALELCSGSRAPVVVPVPSRRATVRKRGYRHLGVLLGRVLRKPRVAVLRLDALRASRGRRSQVGLGAVERERNARLIGVRRSARRVLEGREVILVDDVVTTGATVRAARESLEAAGARVVAIAALCAAERRDTRGGESVWKPTRRVQYGSGKA